MRQDPDAHAFDSAAAAESERPRVLLVDDEESQLKVFRRGLERNGYRVVAMRDVESALETLARESFDIVVSDVTMPGLSGIDLIERMRAAQIDVPVVLATGQPSLETAAKAVEHQVLRYLSKPVTTSDLVRVVDDAVRLHGLARTKRLALDNEGLRSLIEELTRSKNAALAGLQSKREFLSKMSHELRTPMTPIIGMVELLLADQLSPRQREALELVATSATAVMAIIADVLELSSLDRSATRLEPKEFDVRDVVERVVDPFVKRAHAKGLAFDCFVNPSLPPLVLGDPDRFAQVLKYLLDNAIKFTPAGRVGIRLEAEPADADVGVGVSVSDSGLGIPVDALAHVMHAFSQGDDSSTRAYGGAGLGLTIASQLIQLMGGALEIDSLPSSGTTVRFSVRFGSVLADSGFFVDDAFSERQVVERKLTH